MSEAADMPHAEKEAQQFTSAIFEPFAAAYKVWVVRYPMMIAQETLRFASHRLGEQAKFVSKMSGCTNLAQAAEVHSAFLNDAMRDYGKEAELLAQQTHEAVSAEPVAHKAAA